MFNLSFPPEVLESNFAFSAITTMQCKKCQSIFYDPMIAGDAAYYEFLSNNVSWYYSPKRWEYPIVADMLVKENPKLFLEVGCGAGNFLRLARSLRYEGHGFEMNPRHLERLRAEGFHILAELDQSMSQYDALFMFQVLEHMVDPCAFLESVLPRIQPGGIIVLSTPITPSCTAVGANPFLRPPHHLWLPTLHAFTCLSERLGLVCEVMISDPPDYGQVTYALRKWCGYWPNSKSLAQYWAMAGWTALKVATLMRCNWSNVGHTGLAVLRKPRTS